MSVIMRVRTVLTYGTGGPGLHTSYWSPAVAGGSTADATDAVARVRGFWNGIAGQFPTTFAAQVQSDVALIQGTDGSLVGNLSATPVASSAGSSGVASAPHTTMLLARLRTGTVVGGRLLRGRWYLGPPKASAVDTNGATLPAAVTAVNGAGTSLLAPGATASALVVWHRPTSTTVGSQFLVSSIDCWTDLASLRSRRDG